MDPMDTAAVRLLALLERYVIGEASEADVETATVELFEAAEQVSEPASPRRACADDLIDAWMNDRGEALPFLRKLWAFRRQWSDQRKPDP